MNISSPLRRYLRTAGQRISRVVHWELILLTFGAFLTRLPGIGNPGATVFDEVYFAQRFPTAYFNHSYYFDPHPPLGKLLIAAWMWLTHVQPSSVLNGTPAVMRVFIALFGVMIVPLVYGILLKLTRSRLIAGLAGLIIMFNGAVIVESRFVLMDSMLICFGLGALYTALCWRDTRRVYWLILTGLLAGAAASIKWTGLPAIILALIIIDISGHQLRSSWAKTVMRALAVLIVALAVYVSSFWIHFDLLTKTGPGDAFMPRDFQSTLVGNEHYQSKAHLSFWHKLVELNKEMYTANATLKATHPYSSRWYTWPLETRPVYFWEGRVLPNGKQGNIYLMSNPLAWWLCSVSVVFALIVLSVLRLRILYKKHIPVLVFLVLGYFMNWLPFIKIGRIMFLYHYLFALIFATMIMAVLVGGMPVARKQQERIRRISVGALLFVVIVGFLLYSPLVYGWSLTPGQLHALTALHGWR